MSRGWHLLVSLAWAALVAAPAHGSQLPAHIPDIPPEATEIPRPDPPPARSSPDPVLIGALVSAGLAVAGLLVSFLLIIPNRKRRPLREALALIDGEPSDEELEKAETLLSEVLIAGLHSRDVATARFALAYVRARLERYSEAEVVVAELRRTDARDRDTLYLEIWLATHLKHHERIERVFEQHRESLIDFLDSRKIAGIAYLHRARRHWEGREIESALQYFGMLRELGVLVAEIPRHIDDHQLVYGLAALFDKNFDEARQRFESTISTAEEAGKTSELGELGLLLWEWVTEDYPDVDDRLGELIGRLPGTPDDAPRDQEELSSATSDGDDEQALASAPTDRQRRLKRNLLLWHAVSRLFSWMRLPAGDGLPAAELEELGRRLGKVRKIDPDMGDPNLIEGLVGYYFAPGDEQRQSAIDRLEKVLGAEVSLPEVRHLVDRFKELEELESQTLERYLELLGRYLNDQGVPRGLRDQLKQRLDQFRRFKDLGEQDLGNEQEAAAPSLQDIRNRGQLLHRRVECLVRPGLENERDHEAVHRLLGALNEVTGQLAKNTKKLEKNEFELMLTTGEFLLNEE